MKCLTAQLSGKPQACEFLGSAGAGARQPLDLVAVPVVLG